MPLSKPPALSPVRWKWRELKIQSASGQPRGVFKAAISAGWHQIPQELSPRGWGTEGALSTGVGGGGRGTVDVDGDEYYYLDLGLPSAVLAVPDLLQIISPALNYFVSLDRISLSDYF